MPKPGQFSPNQLTGDCPIHGPSPIVQIQVIAIKLDCGCVWAKRGKAGWRRDNYTSTPLPMQRTSLKAGGKRR